MKTFLLSFITTFGISAAVAQSPVDTFRLFKDTVKSAWSQQPDTTNGFRQQPISSQPFSNPPTPAPLTDPINNPNSGQSNNTEYNPPITVPAPSKQQVITPKKRRPVTPVKSATKPLQYDTLPGTKRNG